MRTSFFVVLLLIWLTSCGDEQEITSFQINHLSIPIDSFLQIKLLNTKHSKMMFSPIEDLDKIWFVNQRNPIELCIKSEKLISLEKKFNVPLKDEIYEEAIWKDHLTKDVYIGQLNQKTLWYDAQFDTLKSLDLYAAQAFLSLKNSVLFGTKHGLFIKNRNTGNIKLCPNFPIDLSVKSIEKIGKDSFLLNSGLYLFDLKNKKLTSQTPQMLASQSQALSASFYKNLPKESYRTIKFDTIQYMYSRKSFYFTSDYELVYQFKKLNILPVRKILEDTKHLFIHHSDSLTILSKNWLVENALIFDINTYQNIKRELDTIISNLELKESNLLTIIAEIDSIQKNPKYQQFNDLKRMSEALPKRLFKFQVNHNVRKTLEIAVNKESLPAKIEVYVLNELSQYYIQQGQFSKGIFYGKKCIENFPEASNSWQVHVFPRIFKAKKRLDSLLNLNPQEDAQLFYQAHFNEVCSSLNNSTNNNFPDAITILKKLIQKYPSSEFADDAAYKLLSLENEVYEGTPYIPTLIEQYQSFFKTYPNSSLAPFAKFQMADIFVYAHTYGGEDFLDIESRLSFFEKAEKELNEIITNYSNLLSPVLMEKINRLQATIDRQKIMKSLKISVRLPKDNFTLGDSIPIKIKLENIATQPFNIELFEEFHPFSINLKSENNDLDFRKIYTWYSPREEVSVVKGSPIELSIDLAKMVRENSMGKIGYYNLQAGRIYTVNVCTSNKLCSDAVSFYLK